MVGPHFAPAASGWSQTPFWHARSPSHGWVALHVAPAAPGVTPARFFALLDGFELLVNNVSEGKGTFLARRRPAQQPR